MYKFIWKTFSLWLFSHSLLAAPTHTDWKKIDYIEKAFIEIALKNEYRQTDMRLIKWQAAIHYQFIYQGLPTNPFLEHLTTTHLKQLQSITSHPVTQAKVIPPNLTIIFTQDRYYRAAIKRYIQNDSENLSRESNCTAAFRINEHHEIIDAKVVIPVDYVMRRGLLPACIVEETTQIMGLPNDSDWVFPSIANDQSKLDLLTGLDYILLKLLYLPSLKPGMSFEQMHPVLLQTLRQWETIGIIKNASQKVKESGLYPLIYK